MPTNRQLEGKLFQKEDVGEECWNTPADFFQLLIARMGIQFPAIESEDFVVYGFQTPGEDQKSKLWVKTDRAGSFSGYHLFIKGRWHRIYDYNNREVIWMAGDSRVIDEGFQLIDTTVASIDVPTQQYIMTMYRIDPVNTTPTLTVYNYFAVVYLGL